MFVSINRTIYGRDSNMDNRQQKRVTLRHLASVCNLSVSTVSQILNNRDTYSTEKTKELVRRTAHELGYRPNIGYKLMHGISTKTAAIVLSYSDMMASEYIQKITLSLIDRLNEKGYFTDTVKMPDEWPKRKQAIERVMERGAEFMVALWKPCEWEDLERIAQTIPVAVMGGRNAIDGIGMVDIDVVHGVTRILEHFRESGCRNIRMISDISDPDRMTAFSRFMGIPQDQLGPFIIPLPNDGRLHHNERVPENAVKLGYQLTRELLKRDPDTDAIFYFTDYYALGGAKYLLETGRVIGKDIRIAGYNNTTAVRCCPYPISSVGQNEEETVDLLLEFENGKKPCRILQKPEIFIRD